LYMVMSQMALPSASIARNSMLRYYTGTAQSHVHQGRRWCRCRALWQSFCLTARRATPQSTSAPTRETARRVDGAHVAEAGGDGPGCWRHWCRKQRCLHAAVVVHGSDVGFGDAAEEVLPSAVRMKSRPLGSVKFFHSQQVGSWSSEKLQTWAPPTLRERSEGPQ
jgi:hypothetical protein